MRTSSAPAAQPFFRADTPIRVEDYDAPVEPGKACRSYVAPLGELFPDLDSDDANRALALILTEGRAWVGGGAAPLFLLTLA